MKKLLIGPPGTDWSDHRGQDFLSLDPDDPSLGPVGRLNLFLGGKLRHTYFLGARDPLKMPHVLITGLSKLLPLLSDNGTVQLFGYRNVPMARQTLHLVNSIVQPDSIYVSADIDLSQERFETGPEIIEGLSKGMTLARDAQRRAQWLKLIEQGNRHDVPLESVSLHGARLTSGKNVTEEWNASKFHPVLRAELQGKTLFAVQTLDRDLNEEDVPRYLDHFHATKLVATHPQDYEGLYCCFARNNGDEFGYGRIETVDFDQGVIIAYTEAIAPVPVPILKVGLIRVDQNGREDDELRAWQA